MSRTKLLALCLLIFSVAVPVNAQVQVVTNFTTGGFNTNAGWIRNDALAYEVPGEPETGQNYNEPVANQWYTDDPYVPGVAPLPDVGATSILKHFDTWTLGTAGGGNNSVLFGGYGLADDILPGTANPSLYRSFSLLPLTESVTFSADFGIINSTGSFPNKDRFGFNLLDSTGTISLAQLLFDPASATGPGLGMLWISGSTTNNLGTIAYGALYRMSVAMEATSFDLTFSSLATETNSFGTITNYLVTNSFLLVSGGQLANGLTALDFGTAAVNWELLSGDATVAGNNYMILNDVTVLSTVIPEPGTWAVAALLLAGVTTRLWRRRAGRVSAPTSGA
jgi:hypothetical protein